MNVDSRQCIICRGRRGAITRYRFFPAGRRQFSAYAHKECFEKHREGTVKAQPIAAYKVQIDRWPMTAEKDSVNVVSIIVVSMYQGRPDSHQLGELLSTVGADLLKAEKS